MICFHGAQTRANVSCRSQVPFGTLSSGRGRTTADISGRSKPEEWETQCRRLQIGVGFELSYIGLIESFGSAVQDAYFSR